MRSERLKIIVTVLALILVASPCPGQSLGEVARELRQQKKESRKPAKVFTNDNLPAPSPWEPVTMESSSSSAEPAAKATEQPAGGPSATKNQEAPAEKAKGKKESSEDLEARLKGAKQELAEAQEQQQLSEDELNLLELQQAREGSLNSDLQGQLEEKIGLKKAELESKRATTAKAQERVDDLAKQIEELQAAKEPGSSEQPPKAQPPDAQPPEAPPPEEGSTPSRDAPSDTR